ncbi:MAG: acyl-phosphate glycerol 3-phosphate acyltransferase [Gammaproteobacteria bacterium CG_4_10_14_0_8_um_filter_38_16]|nr:MAG: acyl-phosphate glycerol 3-phosphate acyltransferase [Gammaproteobacteria bacterium CG_4_10_14_0_8_um_filter_38_16]PJA03728.1 MAG: acyl-phosphate glycerol 3-phosphate acyltransferase [Gammaproteobacteria bacterium CG_4_10_14_0_2_um_filter_38_22]PJB09909.1 MAG: acyl-phosphate glycerol 3-phosphate acyltransferase [Gammaproteobacteria bacterium CG_4_9_14_3_um_filter_38_9]
MSALIAIVLAYLLGSLSSAIIISKILKTADPRTAGSGNAGATNMLRIAGKRQALLVMIADILKGLVAVWIGHLFHMHAFWLGLVAFAAVIGHIFPVYFGFKGGKGVATAIGATAGLSFLAGILMAAAWGAVALVTRYSSLASIIAVILAPIFLLIFAKAILFIPSALIAALIIWKHKDNIGRLQNKTETKIEF